MDTRDRIFELLDAQGMEQKAFAEAVGVSEVIVTNWRKGRSKSYKAYLVKIAQVLGTTTADLLGEKQQSSPPSEEDGLPPVWFNLSKDQKQAAVNYMNYLAANGEKL